MTIRRILSSLLLLLPVVVVAEESRPAMPEPLGIGGLVQTLLALVFVLAVFGGLAFLMRRFGRLQQGASGSLRVLGGVSVGQRERVVLIQVGEKQLLLGVAPGRVQTLHVLDEPIDAAPERAERSGAFAERLAAAMKRGGPQR